VEKLEDALTREAHVFHFAGHGQFVGEMGMTYGSLSGKGFIVLLQDTTNRQPILFPVERLALNLVGRGVRLAVLGACEAGRRDQVNTWTGIAPALIRAGIPAVVGMQYTIRDENAIAFSRRFYNALAAGQSIDAAVTDGRLAILNRSDENERDWGVPVVYLRTDEGVLFPKRTAGGPQPVPVTIDKRALRNAMIQAFSLEDLKVLCSDIEQDLASDGITLQVNLDIVGKDSGKSAKVLDLIEYLERRRYLNYLVVAVRKARPGII
jgi:hypothetical protein